MGTIISESAANPFLSPDGLLNGAAVASLQKRVDTAAKKLEAPKVLGIYYTGKPFQNYSAAQDKKGDHKYLTLRGQQVRVKKSRVTPGTKPELYVKKGKVMLVDYDGLPDALEKQLELFVKAANSHNTKAEKVATKVKGEKSKLREAASAEFDKASQELTDMLVEAGIKEANIVEATSMFGKTVLIKLPSGSVIQLGKSDITKFNAAKKAAKEQA